MPRSKNELIKDAVCCSVHDWVSWELRIKQGQVCVVLNDSVST